MLDEWCVEIVAVVAVDDEDVVGAGGEKAVDHPDRFVILGDVAVFGVGDVDRGPDEIDVVEFVVVEFWKVVVVDEDPSVLEFVDDIPVIDIFEFGDDEAIGVAGLLDGGGQRAIAVALEIDLEALGDGFGIGIEGKDPDFPADTVGTAQLADGDVLG